MKQNLGVLRKGEIVGGLLYWPMFLFGSQVLAVLLLHWAGMDVYSDAAAAPINLVFQAINLLVLIPVFHRYLRSQFRRLERRGWGLYGDLALGFALYIGLSLAASTAVDLLSRLGSADYLNTNEEAVEGAVRAQPWLSIPVVCLMAPLNEELMTRGLIFSVVYRRSRFWAYALSMLIFSLIHVYAVLFYQPLLLSLMNMIVYLPAGFVLAWVYERSGTIWTSIFLHMMINTVALLLQAYLA